MDIYLQEYIMVYLSTNRWQIGNEEQSEDPHLGISGMKWNQHVESYLGLEEAFFNCSLFFGIGKDLFNALLNQQECPMITYNLDLIGFFALEFLGEGPNHSMD